MRTYAINPGSRLALNVAIRIHPFSGQLLSPGGPPATSGRGTSPEDMEAPDNDTTTRETVARCVGLAHIYIATKLTAL